MNIHVEMDEKKILFKTSIFWEVTESRRKMYTVVYTEPMMVKKNKKWEWGTEQSEAFAKIKEHLTSAPILTCPDFSQPFQLETDDSDTGFGAMLT